MINKIHQGDCLEVMKQIEDNSIDGVITDPAYNISRKTNFHTMKGKRGTSMNFGEWDKGADITSFIQELPRILKPGANVVIFNSWENLGKIAKTMRENEIEPKRCLVLSKSNPAPFNRDRMFVNDVEFAIWGVYRNSSWTFNRIDEKYQKCVFGVTVQSKKYHPTMKDLIMIKKLVLILSNENDTILDCYSGSGTVSVACKQLNRNFIGIEINPKFVRVAKERLSKVQKESINDILSKFNMKEEEYD